MLGPRAWQGKMQLMNSLYEGSTFWLISGHIVASGIVCRVISLETGRVKLNWTLISYFLKVVLSLSLCAQCKFVFKQEWQNWWHLFLVVNSSTLNWLWCSQTEAWGTNFRKSIKSILHICWLNSGQDQLHEQGSHLQHMKCEWAEVMGEFTLFVVV